MLKKLIALALGSLVAVQMSVVVAEAQASKQNKEDKKEIVVIAQEIQKHIEEAERAGLSQEAAKDLVFGEIEKALIGTSMLSNRNEKILASVCAGIGALVVCVAFLIWIKRSSIHVTLVNPTREDFDNLMDRI